MFYTVLQNVELLRYLAIFWPQPEAGKRGFVYWGYAALKDTFFTGFLWEGGCFQAQQSGKECVFILVWYQHSGQHCTFYLFLLGRVRNFSLGTARVCHAGLHTRIHTVVKSSHPPHPPGYDHDMRIPDSTLTALTAQHPRCCRSLSNMWTIATPPPTGLSFYT